MSETENKGTLTANIDAVNKHITAIIDYLQNGQMYIGDSLIYNLGSDRENLPLKTKDPTEVFDKQEINDLFSKLVADPTNAKETDIKNIQISGDIMSQLQRSFLEQNTSKIRRMYHAANQEDLNGIDLFVIQTNGLFNIS